MLMLTLVRNKDFTPLTDSANSLSEPERGFTPRAQFWLRLDFGLERLKAKKPDEPTGLLTCRIINVCNVKTLRL